MNCKDAYITYKATCAKANGVIPNISDIKPSQYTDALESIKTQIFFLKSCIFEREHYSSKCVSKEERDSGHEFWMKKLRNEYKDLVTKKRAIINLIKEDSVPVSDSSDGGEVTSDSTSDSAEDTEDSIDATDATEDTEDTEDLAEAVVKLNVVPTKKPKKKKEVRVEQVLTRITVKFSHILEVHEFVLRVPDYFTLQDALDIIYGKVQTDTKYEELKGIPRSDYTLVSTAGEIVPESIVVGRVSKLYKIEPTLKDVLAAGIHKTDIKFLTSTVYDAARTFKIIDYVAFKTLLVPLVIALFKNIKKIGEKGGKMDWRDVLERQYSSGMANLYPYVTINHDNWSIMRLLGFTPREWVSLVGAQRESHKLR